jgi:hypothetical protein
MNQINAPKINAPKIKTDLQNNDIQKKFEIQKKINDTKNVMEKTKYSFLIKNSPKLQILIEKQLMDKQKKEKISCKGFCYALYLIFKNFVLKMQDHLLLGGEHAQKIWPSSLSPRRKSLSPRELKEMSPEDKKEIVLNDPKFGMFSLFKYHLKRGYLNNELKKTNKVFCSHIFSLFFALPILIFIGQWLLFLGLILHEINSFDGEYCANTATFENKLMICGISIIYFARSFFIWDSLTNSIGLAKMNRANSFTSIIDTFQEFAFNLFVYGANIWVVFIETDIRNMILNSMAMEFLMILDNEFEELYFRYVPGSAEDIYDNIFVTYKENKAIVEKRKEKDGCFNCFSCLVFIPYKILVIFIFFFPFFCCFMIFAGPICK